MLEFVFGDIPAGTYQIILGEKHLGDLVVQIDQPIHDRICFASDY